MNDVDVKRQLAESALVELYTSWELHGGPSPSVEDEARVIAQAIGSTKTLTQAQADDIWSLHCDGATEREIAAAHLEILEE